MQCGCGYWQIILFLGTDQHNILPTQNYITASCTISKSAVVKNGSEVFTNGAASPAEFFTFAYQHFQFNYPKFYKMDNLSKLGWLAAEILLKDNFDASTYQPEQVGVVLANANSSLDNDLKYFESVKDIASPGLFVYTLPNIVIGEICIRNNFKGEHALYIQNTFDAGFIEQQVNYLLNNDLLQACICGWADILGEDYKATLFLVEKDKRGESLLFNKTNMDDLFGVIQ